MIKETTPYRLRMRAPLWPSDDEPEAEPQVWNVKRLVQPARTLPTKRETHDQEVILSRAA